MAKPAPNMTLEKKTTHASTVSFQFAELCALLKGQYTSMRVTTPVSVRLLEGAELQRTLRDAKPVDVKDNSGRRTGAKSDYYVARIFSNS